MPSTRNIIAGAAIIATAAALRGRATTTRYYDGHRGACGCGPQNGMFPWQTGIGEGIHTAAGSQSLFDADGSAWCGTGCGKCFKLTSTGSAPHLQGTGGHAGQNITVMLTNLCPNQGNEQWCPAKAGEKNEFGFDYHFDIMARDHNTEPVFGDNPIVEFESVPCPGEARKDYDQCACHAHSGGHSEGGSSPPPSSGSGSKGGSGSKSGDVGHFGQCGGRGYTGSSTCESPYKCKKQNQYYSQCE